jgi:hypothetical protein
MTIVFRFPFFSLQWRQHFKDKYTFFIIFTIDWNFRSLFGELLTAEREGKRERETRPFNWSFKIQLTVRACFVCICVCVCVRAPFSCSHAKRTWRDLSNFANRILEFYLKLSKLKIEIQHCHTYIPYPFTETSKQSLPWRRNRRFTYSHVHLYHIAVYFKAGQY